MRQSNRYLFLIFVCLCLMCLSCASPEVTLKPYWVENEDKFFTNEVTKAQVQTPFPLIIPTYVSHKPAKWNIPDLEGSLFSKTNDSKQEVIIKYILYTDDKLSGMISINENNKNISLGDPELNPELEEIELLGIPAIKTKDEWSSGVTVYISFSFNYISYLTTTDYVGTEETIKITESIIKQILNMS
jgi:hypothetical protein